MTLRTRFALTTSGAVLVAVLGVTLVAYGTTQWRLDRDLDRQLLAAAEQVVAADLGILEALDALDGPGPRQSRVLDRGRERLAGRAGMVTRLLQPVGGGVVQLTTPQGDVLPFGDVELSRSATFGRMADPDARLDDERPSFSDELAGDQRVRVVSVPLDGPGSVQVAALLDGDEPFLTALRRQLVLAGLLGAGLAGLLGWAVAGRAMAPVRRLTDATDEVRRTSDLATRIPTSGEDELGRLAGSFNAMLAALEAARHAQTQLVADASHQLRTPITSLRTNLEVLRDDGDRLTSPDRSALLRDVTLQLEELGRLVDGLVELARGDRPAQAPTPLALGPLVEEVVDRVAVTAPDVEVRLTTDASVVVAERDRLERAVANLLDNAVKHGGGAPVEVTVDDGTVTVRDHGPGIPAEDVARVFERFYRAPAARQLPGSGLGLSIVAQVARANGGQVTADNDPAGGAVLSLRLPPAGATPGS